MEKEMNDMRSLYGSPGGIDGLGRTVADIEAESGPEAAFAYLLGHESEIKSHGGLLHQLGQLAFDLDRYGFALSAFRAAQAQGFDSYSDIGLVQECLGEVDAALVTYSEALSRQPEDLDSLVNLGVLLCSLNRQAEAVDPLRRAAKIDPKTSWQLADALLTLEGEESAISALHDAVSAGEDRAYVELVELTAADLSINEIRESLLRAEAAGSHVARSDLVAYLTDADLPLEAIAMGRQAAEKGDRLVVGPLAGAYEGIGNISEARRLYAQAVEDGQVQYSLDLQRVAASSDDAGQP
ncbi:hypothetical protein [Frigoribacterium sp. VKM Ac-2836]|uniref:hypothetical protein n=1 Tax=Frigoribacterium sp. VKM Ac-2836 TaxID=2739014 RepID=UPI001565F78D|nr:hypothetical protein [Frigoribacterium sp. VKM Ac-2836]NRD27692.1 hypothetical protein [Frigoribacterium sp. VKM Ac-2836]